MGETESSFVSFLVRKSGSPKGSKACGGGEALVKRKEGCPVEVGPKVSAFGLPCTKSLVDLVNTGTKTN